MLINQFEWIVYIKHTKLFLQVRIAYVGNLLAIAGVSMNELKQSPPN